MSLCFTEDGLFTLETVRYAEAPGEKVVTLLCRVVGVRLLDHLMQRSNVELPEADRREPRSGG